MEMLNLFKSYRNFANPWYRYVANTSFRLSFSMQSELRALQQFAFEKSRDRPLREEPKLQIPPSP